MLKLFNSMSRHLEDFTPADGKTALIYSCGPTVYDFAHLGNFRTFVFGDILCRWLRYLGYETRQVMNVTDVDDKTIAGALRQGLPLQEFTRGYEQAFMEDLATLRIEPAWKYPRATEHVPQMLELISTLVENGHAVVEEGSVYFSISSFPEYGKLSGERPDAESRDSSFGRLDGDSYERGEAADFALWKAQKDPAEPAWESPWGPGRPGWHIECSAMSMQYLGVTLDIHNGGVDLLFPHHENEIAQSEAATGEPFARLWVHSEFLMLDGRKMSKSLGNYLTLRDLMPAGDSPSPERRKYACEKLAARLREAYDPMVVRHQLLAAHYRKQLNFTVEGLEQSAAALERLSNFVDRLRQSPLAEGPAGAAQEVAARGTAGLEAAMNDDLNTPGAMGALFEMLREVNPLLDRGELTTGDREAVLTALGNADRALGFLGPILQTEGSDEDAEIDALVAQRREARANKDFATSDRIRDELAARGIIIEDGPAGTIWRRRH